MLRAELIYIFASRSPLKNCHEQKLVKFNLAMLQYYCQI